MALIVSLTSTSFRLPILRYTLCSLFEQSLHIDRLVLNLSKDAYLMDEGVSELPSWLHQFREKDNFEIKWVENSGPYRKLLPVFSEARDDDLIVTCDDDVIYGKGWLHSLVECAERKPELIVCGRARVPIKNAFGFHQSYINWPVAAPGTEGQELLPTGVPGVVYRKALVDKRIMTSKDYLALAPRQDDLWFSWARQVAGFGVLVSPETHKHVNQIQTHQTLSGSNLLQSSSGWELFLRAFVQRLLPGIKGYMGISVCENDVAFKKINKSGALAIAAM